MTANDVPELLRELAPQALAVLLRRYADLDATEDAVQEALIVASTTWPVDGVPDNPTGWLVTVAARRWTDRWRQDAARRRREEHTAALAAAEPAAVTGLDDSLALLFMCCHPALNTSAQVALTLRAVGGLTTAEVARALLATEGSIARRIGRAKLRIRSSRVRFELPRYEDVPERTTAVLAVLYLIFNEGSTASSGDALHRVELSSEAIRLARQLRAALPDDGEVAGLLALMLLTDARRPARSRPDGSIVPLTEQDRSLWDRDGIREGVDMVTWALSHTTVGPYQVQAAIAAVHDEAPQAQDTDWPQVLLLYGLLDALAPGPMVTLNRIVALAMVDGAPAGLRALSETDDPALAGHHRTAAVKAHLLEMTGEPGLARQWYLLAADRTLNEPERNYLFGRAHEQGRTGNRTQATDQAAGRSGPAG